MKKMSRKFGGKQNPPSFQPGATKTKGVVKPAPQPGSKPESKKMLTNAKAATAKKKEGFRKIKAPVKKIKK